MRRCLFTFFVFILCQPQAAHALSSKGFESLNTFSKVLHNIVNYHVNPPSEEDLIDGAIRGLFESLDPHSAYLPPKVFRELKAETGGRFGGIGLEVVFKQGWLTVVAPIDGTPAAKAGIKPGDRIVKIDGVSTKQMDISQAVAKMRGRPNSAITLTLLRRGGRIPFDVTMRRATINVPSVRAEMLAPGYPYIRITSFQEQTYSDLLNTLEDLAQQGTVKGMILDLRNNPGGLLDQAVAMSDLFLRKGMIVTTQSRGQVIDRREAHVQGTLPDFPLAILVNGGSASASEIVTGALQDHRRALVLGTQTFGKGSVQTVIEFEDGAALKLTIARYYTPKKRSIQAFGITPDVIVPEEGPGQEVEVVDEPDMLSESELPGHLKRERLKQKRRHGRVKVQLPAVDLAPDDSDYQKAVALKLLQNGTVAKQTRLRGRHK